MKAYIIVSCCLVIISDMLPSRHNYFICLCRFRLSQLFQMVSAILVFSDLMTGSHEIAMLAMKIMHTVQLPPALLDSSTVLKLSSNVINFFFHCLHSKGNYYLVNKSAH